MENLQGRLTPDNTVIPKPMKFDYLKGDMTRLLRLRRNTAYDSSVHSRQVLKIGLNSCRVINVRVPVIELICIFRRVLYTGMLTG